MKIVPLALLAYAMPAAANPLFARHHSAGREQIVLATQHEPIQFVPVTEGGKPTAVLTAKPVPAGLSQQK